MKTKVKITFVSLLLLCMTMSLFAGGKQASAPSGPVTIELWYGLSVTEAPPPPANWKVLDMIRDDLGINLVITALPSNENDQDVRINAAASSRSLPDIFQIRRQPWENLIRMGLVASVDDLYAMMPTRTRQMYNADSRAYTTMNGKSYGLASESTISKNEGVVIRKDWLDKLGLKVPVTTEDYINVMRAFTQNDPDGNGRNDTYGFGAFLEQTPPYEDGLGRRFDAILGAFGVAGVWSLDSKNAGLVVKNPAMFDALTYVKRMVDERIIDPNWTSYSKDDFRAAWKQGRFGIMKEQFAALTAANNYAPFDTNFPNGEWIVIDPPKGPNGHSSAGVFPVPYRMFAVSSSAIQQGKGPAIAKLLEWMSTKGYNMIGWGEQGVNFVLDSAGAPTSRGVPNPDLAWDKPNIVNITQLRNMVFYNSEIEILSRYPTYRTAASGKTINMLNYMTEMQKRPWTPNNGANVLPSPNADVQRFYQQGIIEFVTGQRQLTRANWDAWLAEFERVGGRAWNDAGVNQARTEGYLY